MNKLTITLLALLFMTIPSVSCAEVAFDVFSSSSAGTGNLSWTHTPTGTPKAVIVQIVDSTTSVDNVTSASYGSLSLTEVSGSPNIHTVGELGAVHMFFGGSGIPIGAQTVTVMMSGTTSTKIASAITLTANNNTEVVISDGSIVGSALTNPSVILNLNGRTSFVCIAFFSGRDDVTQISPFTDWTDRLEYDFGLETGGWYTYNIIGSSNVSAGWTQAVEDGAMIAMAISEAPITGFIRSVPRRKAILR